jgi:hypothetical protein
VSTHARRRLAQPRQRPRDGAHGDQRQQHAQAQRQQLRRQALPGEELQLLQEIGVGQRAAQIEPLARLGLGLDDQEGRRPLGRDQRGLDPALRQVAQQRTAG